MDSFGKVPVDYSSGILAFFLIMLYLKLVAVAGNEVNRLSGYDKAVSCFEKNRN